MMEGFEVPIHRSLTEQILIGGVPRELAIINATFGAGFGFSLQSWLTVPVFIIIHILAMIATKKDPQFLDCLKRLIRQKSYYST